MPPINTAVAMPVASGWMMAVDFNHEDNQSSNDTDSPLLPGRYVAALNRIDCEGCAASVESAVQQIHGIGMAGVAPRSSTLVFEVASRATVTLADIRDVLAAVSDALKTVILLSGLSGPLPLVYSAS